MAAQEDVTIDITPTPRILQMLGEVDLPPRRCFAEFIDNALDEGVDGTPGQVPDDMGGNPLRIEIETPTIHEFDDDYENAEVVVHDNGPGMSPDELEDNLKAGYSGKDPMGNMGLFGVGFNIATARLGSRTTVRTTRAGDESWAVATIDFRELVANDTYDVNVTFEEKMNSSDHGTKIVVDQLQEFSRTLRRKQKLKPGLARMYTSVLKNNNVELYFNGDRIEARPHCIWSSERSVEIDSEEFPAIIDVDKKVGEGYFCKECWSWWDERLIKGDDDQGYTCPACGPESEVVHREQRVWGWVGIQRFFDQQHYGIDLIRNGRIIEELDKSLFYWENPETGQLEKEYPIDTEQWGGRIVGELHIDFVPVTNVKDGFRKENDRWRKVREAIRGKMSFRPTYARKHGYEPNRSPLGRLFKGYRTGNEAGKKRLVPGEVQEDGSVKGINAEPAEWADRFWEGDPEYQDDTKWWEAVERAEKAKRSSGNPFADEDSGTNEDDEGEQGDDHGSGGSQGFDLDPDSEGPESDETENGEGPDSRPGSEEDEEQEQDSETTLESEEDSDVSGSYGLEEIDEPEIEVSAHRVTNGSLGGQPVVVESQGWSQRKITYDPGHELFSGFGYNPIDSVLMEIASTLLTRMDDPEGWTQCRIYAALIHKYRGDQQVSTGDLARTATEQLKEIKRRVAAAQFEHDGYEVKTDVEEEVTRGFLDSGGETGELEELFETSAFLEYVPHRELIRYFKTHPEAFFDGTVWDLAYSSLPSAELQQELVDEYVAYLRDAQMLADEGLDLEIDGAGTGQQMEVERAAVSVQILKAKLNPVE